MNKIDKIDLNELMLYGIISKDNLTIEEYLKKIEDSILGGVTILQLREKNLNDKKFIELALLAKKITDKYQIKLIINDNINVCLGVDAHGIHIGQDDLSPNIVRRRLGPKKIIGLSIQKLEHLYSSSNEDIDYYGVGALLPTKTKDDAVLVDRETLRKICKESTLPVVGIGGLNYKNIDKFKDHGLNGLCFVSAIYSSSDPYIISKKLYLKLKSITKGRV